MKYLLIFLVVLTSCHRSSDPRLIDEMEREFEIVAQHSRGFSLLPFDRVQQVYMNNTSENKEIYTLAKKGHTNAELFYSKVDSVLKQDKLTSHDVDHICNAHRSAMDSLTFGIASNRLAKITLDSLVFSIGQYGESFPKLSILALANNFAINASKVQNLLYREMDTNHDWIPEFSSKVSAQTSVNKDGTVDVYLNSPLFRPVEPITFIDTVLLNGKIIHPNMVVSQSQSIASARFSAIGSGHYRLLGKVRFTAATGQTYDYPFSEEFEVK